MENLSEQGQLNLQHYEQLLQAGQGDGQIIQQGTNGHIEGSVVRCVTVFMVNKLIFCWCIYRYFQ